jgi:hypothetical protein
MLIRSTDHQVIIELLCGPQDHNEHCKGWCWELYLQDAKRATDAFLEEHRQQIAARRAAREIAS